MARVLVTGASGAVGRPVVRELRARGHEVRCLDRAAAPEGEGSWRVDIAGRTAVSRAVGGCDCVVHLAAEAHDRDFFELLSPNVAGLFNIMDAARRRGVKRVILASSIQVLGKRDERKRPASVDDARPVNHYALTKLWAEQMGRMYSRRYQLSVIAARVAWMVRDRKEAEHMQHRRLFDLYLSARDAGRFFACAVEAKPLDFAVVYAASRGGERWFDMEPARRLLGYEARDRWPEGLGFAL